MAIQPDNFVRVIKEQNMGPLIGVPCSILAPLLKYVIDNPDVIEYFNPPNEAHALGLATGFYMGAQKIPVVLMQNSGLGNIINSLTSLNQLYKVPALLIITWRGFGGVGADAPEHDIMGRDLEEYLDVFNIPYEILSDDNYANQMKRLKDIAQNDKIPVAAIIKKGFFDAGSNICESLENIDNVDKLKRWDAIRIIKESLDDFTFLSTTGFINRESFDIKDSLDFYMLGSMGLISSIGCGVALSLNEKKVAVLDGDGAILMHLGQLPFIGSCKPKNFLHFILDNEVYASTKNQPTVSTSVDFEKLAYSCGYRGAYVVRSSEKLEECLESAKKQEGPILVCVKVASGNKEEIGRVLHSPEEIKDRFMGAIK